MKRGLLGFAIWDHGDKTSDGDLYAEQPDFYKKDLAYKLNHWGERDLRATEMQPEARFHNRNAKTWYDLDLMSISDFPRFILNNRFLSYHLRSMGVDIADAYDDNHRDYSLGETIGSMIFAFTLKPDMITLHPGTQWNGSWPSNIYDAKNVLDDRSDALKNSLWHVI